METIENPEKKIEITFPTENDMRGVNEVFYKTWLATYPNEELGITKDDIKYRFRDYFTDERLANGWEKIKSEKDGRLVLAKEGEKVIGLVRATFHPDKNQLQAIYVLPEYQRMGIGKILWDEAQKLFDSTKDTIVQVATYNTQAIEFYKQLGFNDNGKRLDDEKLRMKSGAIIPQLEMEIKALNESKG